MIRSEIFSFVDIDVIIFNPLLKSRQGDCDFSRLINGFTLGFHGGCWMLVYCFTRPIDGSDKCSSLCHGVKKILSYMWDG